MLNYTVEDGIPSSECYEIFQDSKGLIWIGTDKGVCKYNGTVFKKYSTENGLPDNTIFGFFEDSKKRLWGKTLSGGIFYFENDSIHIPVFNSNLKKQLGAFIIDDIYIDVNDSVYIETSDLRLLKMHFSSAAISVTSKNTTNVQFYGIKGLTYGGLTSGNDVNITREISFIKNNKRCSFIIENDKHNAGMFKKLILRNGDLLFNYGEKLYKTDFSSRLEKIKEFKNRILSIYEDKDLGIWIGTLNDGLYYFKYGINTLPAHYFDDESITSVTEDTEGGMWVTTLKSGIYYIPNKNALSISFLKESFNVIKPIDGILKGGSKNGNIYSFDTTGVLNKINLGSSFTNGNLVYDIMDIDKNTYLAGGLRSFLVNKNNPSLIRKFLDGIYTKEIITNDSISIYYFFSYSNILKIDKKAEKLITEYHFGNSRIVSMFLINKNELLLGTANGLWKFKDSTFEFLGANDPALNARINSIVKFRNNYLLSTNGKGILIYDPKTEKTESITESEGLSSNICEKAIVDGDNIWVATNKGISFIKMNKKYNSFNYVKIFDKHDGLPGQEVNNIYVDDKNVWVASNSGISYFNKTNELNNTTPPLIYFDYLKTNKNTYSTATENLELKHDENYIEIGFYGISYKSFNSLRYKYILTGADETWHYTTDQKITYPSLPPGKYTFQVFCVNNDNISSRQCVLFHFEIFPPYWKTWWFTSLWAITLAALIFSFFYYRLRTIKIRERERSIYKNRILDYEMRALRAQMNPHFIFNAAASIQHFILSNDLKSANKYLVKFSRLIRGVLENSKNSLIPIKNELSTLELYIEIENLRFSQRINYKIVTSKEIDQENFLIPPMFIQPFVENAIWHGLLPKESDCLLLVELRLEENKILCIIDDNGVGRNNNINNTIKIEKSRSLGVEITNERLIALEKLYKIDLKINIIDKKSEQGHPLGTKVIITLPIINK